MNRSQRQSHLDKFFAALAREFALRRGLVYAGTLRRLPPPPFPGTQPEPTRYFVNALFPDEGVTRLTELDERLRGVLHQAELWVEDERGTAPKIDQVPRIVARTAGSTGARSPKRPTSSPTAAAVRKPRTPRTARKARG